MLLRGVVETVDSIVGRDGRRDEDGGAVGRDGRREDGGGSRPRRWSR